jgi:hypothetical protein
VEFYAPPVRLHFTGYTAPLAALRLRPYKEMARLIRRTPPAGLPTLAACLRQGGWGPPGRRRRGGAARRLAVRGGTAICNVPTLRNAGAAMLCAVTARAGQPFRGSQSCRAHYESQLWHCRYAETARRFGAEGATSGVWKLFVAGVPAAPQPQRTTQCVWRYRHHFWGVRKENANTLRESGAKNSKHASCRMPR